MKGLGEMTISELIAELIKKTLEYDKFFCFRGPDGWQIAKQEILGIQKEIDERFSRKLDVTKAYYCPN